MHTLWFCAEWRPKPQDGWAGLSALAITVAVFCFSHHLHIQSGSHSTDRQNIVPTCLRCSLVFHTWSCLGPLLTVMQAVMVLWHTERHSVRRITTHMRPRTSLHRRNKTCLFCSRWEEHWLFLYANQSRHALIVTRYPRSLTLARRKNRIPRMLPK